MREREAELILKLTYYIAALITLAITVAKFILDVS
jgi:hypothetical protein